MAATRLHSREHTGSVLMSLTWKPIPEKERTKEWSSEWASKYVGVPYESRGRTREGCDCWGLVCLVYAEHFGIALPSFADAYESAQDMIEVDGLITSRKGSFEEIESPAPADIVLCRVLGYETHVGVYAGDHLMLHIMKGTDACIVNLNSAMWKRRVVGYFRNSTVMPTAT